MALIIMLTPDEISIQPEYEIDLGDEKLFTDFEIGGDRIQKVLQELHEKFLVLQHIPFLCSNDGDILQTFLVPKEVDLVLSALKTLSSISIGIKPTSDEVNNTNKFKTAIEIILQSKPLIQFLKSIQNPTYFEVTKFTESIADFQKVIDYKLRISGEEEFKMNLKLRETFIQNAELKTHIQQISKIFHQEQDDLQFIFNEKLDTENSLEENIKKLGNKFDYDVQHTVTNTENLITSTTKNNGDIQHNLEEKVLNLTRTNQLMLTDHCLKEEMKKDMRKNVLSKLWSWLDKFDKDLNNLQMEFEGLQDMYNKKRKQMEDLERKFDVQEMEYVLLMTEKREEEERIFNEKLTRYVQDRAARRLQRAWMEYKIAKKTKKKKKKSKK